MSYVYLLYSQRLDRYYTGATQYSPEERLLQHNNKHYKSSYTFSGIPWEIYFVIRCETISQARAIEGHIKRMKSKTYIENLKKYPEMSNKLLQQYQDYA
jgi:putative endonuclease